MILSFWKTQWTIELTLSTSYRCASTLASQLRPGWSRGSIGTSARCTSHWSISIRAYNFLRAVSSLHKKRWTSSRSHCRNSQHLCNRHPSHAWWRQAAVTASLLAITAPIWAEVMSSVTGEIYFSNTSKICSWFLLSKRATSSKTSWMWKFDILSSTTLQAFPIIWVMFRAKICNQKVSRDRNFRILKMVKLIILPTPGAPSTHILSWAVARQLPLICKVLDSKDWMPISQTLKSRSDHPTSMLAAGTPRKLIWARPRNRGRGFRREFQRAKWTWNNSQWVKDTNKLNIAIITDQKVFKDTKKSQMNTDNKVYL